MAYTFEILGVAPVLEFFNHQQTLLHHPPRQAVNYLGAYRCTLDALIQSVETVPPHSGWHLDQAIQTVIDFWMRNTDSVHHWRKRLDDAGAQNLLVSRLSTFEALRSEFDLLLD
ncbi:hypothetical protein [Pantanalinema sp. GBBB05]|uniref:hypothetical protein n=1 Tax=Pantanalinema sp. GBBB05 TaxID=2604139 RepID=UPI001DDFBA8C|nr:hypothetical protein [Pantanalinema sp. GBBB05]